MPLRVAVGSSLIWRPVIVLLSSALVVCPISSLILTVAATPAAISTPVFLEDLKPGCATVTSYLPDGIEGSAYSPRSLVVVRTTALVSTLVTETSAPGTAAPAGSVTCPFISAVLPCPNAIQAQNPRDRTSFCIMYPFRRWPKLVSALLFLAPGTLSQTPFGGTISQADGVSKAFREGAPRFG